MRATASWLSCLGLAGLILASPSSAAEMSFAYKNSYRNVAKDPDGIWTGNDLAIGPKGTVTIHEFVLRTPKGELIVSQIWNEDCSSGTCPTRLVRVDSDGRRTVLVADLMHQIVPPDDPRFADLAANKTLTQFAQHPFALSEDGMTLVNGDYKFAITGAKP